MAMITLHSTVVASANQLSTHLDGEVVILDLGTGTYYGLADIAARIWTLLQEPTTCAQMAAKLADDYAVDLDRLETDLVAFVHNLKEIGLVDVR